MESLSIPQNTILLPETHWQKVGFQLSHEQNESLKGESGGIARAYFSWAEAEISSTEKEALLIEKNEDYLQQIDAMGREEILLE